MRYGIVEAMMIKVETTLAEALSMVGEQQKDGIVPVTARFQHPCETTHLSIHLANLTVILCDDISIVIGITQFHIVQQCIVVFRVNAFHLSQVNRTRVWFVMQRIIGRLWSIGRMRLPVVHKKKQRVPAIFLDQAQSTVGELLALIGKGFVYEA